MLLLYDYSFLPPGCATKEQCLEYTHGTEIVCTDEHLLHPYPSRGSFASSARDSVSRGRIAWRYVDEALDVLAAGEPGLHEALTGLGEGDFVLVDGTLIPINRIRADEPYYSMRHRHHGMNHSSSPARTAPHCGSQAPHRHAPTT